MRRHIRRLASIRGMAPKVNYHVVPIGTEWLIQREHETASRGYSNKEEAVEEARRMAMRDEASLWIHSRDGRMQEERTYGDDPFPPPG